MTSRFGKTYNRKGGEANSKFEEVFSNKKPTLTTKWGETTYKAQLGGKKPSLKPGGPEVSKRPRLEDSDSEDPFGFDSDEESKAVTSDNVSELKMPEEDVPKPVTAQGRVTATVVTPAQGSASITATFTNKQTSANDFKNNQPWYKSALAGNQKPVYVTYVSETVLFDNENLSLFQTPVSSSSNLDPTLLANVPGGMQNIQPACSYDGSLSEEMKSADQELSTEPPPEPVDNIPPSPFTLRASNCKKYQRPYRSNKTLTETGESNSDKPIDPASAQDKSNSVLSASASSTAASANTVAKPAGRGGGRVRDYTVLHPSCLSVCNVTIQDSMDRSIDELVTQPTPADLGEAGQMKKKTDTQPPKPTRFRPAQTKTKKTKAETKLEFFGFEDKDGEGEDTSSEGAMAGKSSYKIKYFGFDDLSESDSDDENSQAKEKKAKRAAAALAALSSSVDSPHTSDSQDSQASSNTDAFEFCDDSSPGVTEGQRGRPAKQGDKSKDSATGLKKIFSGPKKSPSKAVYNARHWNQPESEEIPAPPLSRSPTSPAILSSSNKDNNAHKDDGLFKAPPPPPKVIKSETIPTRPNQEIVTALKCRKEDKE
ncbi:hypothetical protein ILYODFUR_017440, partial [Ilyodon furcidens]